VALAVAVKVELMPYPSADPMEPDATGRAVLNYVKGADKTEVQVNCWGLMADKEYTVLLMVPAGFHPIGSFTTDDEGEGHLHAKLPVDHSMHLPVAVNNDMDQTVLLGP
jgi:hypothetical protein